MVCRVARGANKRDASLLATIRRELPLLPRWGQDPRSPALHSARYWMLDVFDGGARSASLAGDAVDL